MAVYEVSIPKDMLLSLLGIESIEGISESLKANLMAKSITAIGPQIIAIGGVNNLAAASLCTASQSFLSTDFTGNTIYIYTYENSSPVMVAFSGGQDKTVTATSCFLLYDALTTNSREEIERFFTEFGAEVTIVER